ncbi:glycosyltransferase [Alterisphingorhabdus coralli]|uniref:Glycosyltransferase n=1 Tax=Alterisphingorhabdus coralli TaxID=3071408 RepID=A0AA97I0R4_9SPHN|nr:glycosyltransferase [Parasphingorhabdus sp. SCSIO 66989]WOE74030.1 glycosyltransferase [Parasphingorhabdus sp. SCSIO 66989]
MTKLAVIIPCYKVRSHIRNVIANIGPEIERIYVVDDKCPEESGQFVRDFITDKRIHVIMHEYNKGVGGAVVTGYRAALGDGMDIAIKVDGDGQMDPRLASVIAEPVIAGKADYSKGNRFHSVYNVRKMPVARLMGNAALSFITKLSSGYWSIFDPTNGYTAIHRTALSRLEFANIDERYFFETDMLINLGNSRAVVKDVAMEAIYADEESNLKIKKVLGQFLGKNLKEMIKRIVYTYYLRDFSLASAQLLLGAAMLLFGLVFGAIHWTGSITTGETASTGTIMVATLPIILGFQLLLSFLGFDISNEPKDVLQHYRHFPEEKALSRSAVTMHKARNERSDARINER